MPSTSKFIKLDQNLLLEWIFDSENMIQEDYQVLTNLSLSRRGYMSMSGLNISSNTIFPIDTVLNKYAKEDPDKYNFLKLESYSSSYTEFNKLRFHFPTSYSFSDNSYIGLFSRIYTLDYTNQIPIDLCSYMYDDTNVNSSNDIIYNDGFYYDGQYWGKYITFDVPSVDVISKQRTSSVSTDLPISGSINDNLTKGVGLSQTAPLFIDYSWVSSKQDLLGNTYYFLSTIFNKTLSKTPDYNTLAVNIDESVDGDYFEIYGTYGGTNELLDNFITDQAAKGRENNIEYIVKLYEENILMNTQTFLVTDNFSNKIIFRPVLMFTNTTAAIDIEMKVIDLVDNSSISKFTSISLTTNIFKYGKKLSKINVDNIFKPKIYNLKTYNSPGSVPENQNPDININKVNYPVLSDKVKILVNSTQSTSSDYKSMGLSQIIINAFGNVFKFMVATTDSNNNAVPFNLANVTENATITMTFKSSTDLLEKEMWYESGDNNFENGIVVFKIDQSDISLIKKIGKENKIYYLTIKSKKTGVISLLYSGTWVAFEDIKFVDVPIYATNSATTTNFVDGTSLSAATIFTENLTPITSILYIQSKNYLVFLNPNANVGTFESYLTTNKAKVYFKKPGGNSVNLAFVYMLINVMPAFANDIKNQIEVNEIIELPNNTNIVSEKTDSISTSAINEANKYVDKFTNVTQSTNTSTISNNVTKKVLPLPSVEDGLNYIAQQKQWGSTVEEYAGYFGITTDQAKSQFSEMINYQKIMSYDYGVRALVNGQWVRLPQQGNNQAALFGRTYITGGVDEMYIYPNYGLSVTEYKRCTVVIYPIEFFQNYYDNYLNANWVLYDSRTI